MLHFFRIPKLPDISKHFIKSVEKVLFQVLFREGIFQDFGLFHGVFCCTFCVEIYKEFKVNIWQITKFDLLKFLCVRNFRNKMVCRVYSNISWYSKIRLCKRGHMFSFLALIKNSGTIELIFLLLSISPIFIFIWIAFFNIFTIITLIIRVFKKSSKSIKCVNLVLSYQYVVGDFLN